MDWEEQPKVVRSEKATTIFQETSLNLICSLKVYHLSATLLLLSKSAIVIEN